MAISSSLRRHSLRHLRRLASAASSPTTLSISAAKSRLRAEHDPDAALSILSSVAETPSSPVSARFALDLTIRRLARSRRFADIEALLEPRKRSPAAAQEPYLATLILSYGTAGMLDHALKTFEDSSAPRSVFSFNALLTACLRAGRPRRIPALFSELSAKHSIEPDAISYALLAKSFSRSPSRALEILNTMEEKRISPNTVIYTTILDTLYKNGSLDEAEKLWNEMVEKGCPLDLPAYNVRVMHSATNGTPDDVLRLIVEMESAGVKPDTITYNYLMTSYCNAGRLEEAKELYRGLHKKGCSPNATTYKNLLQSLCENGDFDAGLEVYRDSAKQNRIPVFGTMRLLVEGLVKVSKIDAAKEVIAEVRKKFPEKLSAGWKKVEKELGLVEEEEVVSDDEPKLHRL